MIAMPKKFEIRVAVIGYVSVGKTTVINALFGAEYGEVSMRRTTAVVNSYRIINRYDKKAKDIDVYVPSDALAESKGDNKEHRTSDSVKEITYDIHLEDPLHTMREDTALVIVDIPGLNEADTCSKYKDYVNANWHTFDAIMVVMDGRQGVNTEEQLDLMKMVKKNLETIKEIPSIILLNKIDHPDDGELSVLVAEARAEVAKLFGVSDPSEGLRSILADLDHEEDRLAKGCKETIFPAVIPLSAMHAFLYRCGSRLSFDEFQMMDEDFIDKIGSESYGRQWRRYDDAKKYRKAFEAVSDYEQCEDGLQASNFGVVVRVLAFILGNHNRQKSILQAQVTISLDRMVRAEEGSSLSAEVMTAYRKIEVLGGVPLSELTSSFWRAFEKVKADSILAFKEELNPIAFSRPLAELASLLEVEVSMMDGATGWPRQVERIAEVAKDLLLQYAAEIIDHEEELSKAKMDFVTVVGSMLLASSSSSIFPKEFGSLKIILDAHYASALKNVLMSDENHCQKCYRKLSSTTGWNSKPCATCSIDWMTTCPSSYSYCPCCRSNASNYSQLTHCNSTEDGLDTWTCNYANCSRKFAKFLAHPPKKMKVDGGNLIPAGPNYLASSVVVPKSFDNPNHFGFPIWKCCQILERAEGLVEQDQSD